MNRLPASEPASCMSARMTSHTPASESATSAQRSGETRACCTSTRHSSVIIGTSAIISEAAEAVVRARPEYSKK